MDQQVWDEVFVKPVKKRRRQKKSKRNKNKLESLNLTALKWNDVDGVIFFTKKRNKKVVGTIIDDLSKYVDSTKKAEKSLPVGATKLTEEDQRACKALYIVVLENFLKENDMTNIKELAVFNEIVAKLDKCIGEIMDYLYAKWRKSCLSVPIDWIIPKYLNKSPEFLIKHFINQAQMTAFFRFILKYFFSLKLFGEKNSMNLCKKIARAIINAKCGEPIFEKRLILSGFKYNDMKWFKCLSSKDKITIGNNFIRFFTNFCVEIILKCFHCEADSDRLIRFYRKDAWRRIKENSIKKFIIDRKAVVIDKNQSDYHYFLNFIPKSTTTRPIEVFQDDKTKEEFKIVNRSLIYLIEINNIYTGFGLSKISTFANILRMFATRNKTNSNGYYCFSGDFTNCYPSIDHEILKIALELIIPRDTVLHVGFYIPKDRKWRRFMPPKIIIGKTVKEIEDFAKKNKLVKVDLDNKIIETNKIFDYIFKYAMKSVVKFDGKYYKCYRGISQGNQLSTTLCNIYLAHIERQLFNNNEENLSQFLYGQKALLFRYIDDYLLISKDGDLATKVIMKLLNEADKEYGMKMNSKKIKVSNNLSQLKNIIRESQFCTFKENTKIPWCGILIDPKNLTISIDEKRFEKRKKRIAMKNFGNDDTKMNWIIKTTKSLIKWKLKLVKPTIRIYKPSETRNIAINEMSNAVIKNFANYFRKRMRINYKFYREKIKSLRIFIRMFIKKRRKNLKKHERMAKKLRSKQ